MIVKSFINAYNIEFVILLLNKYPNCEGFEFNGEVVLRNVLQKVCDAYETLEGFGGIYSAKSHYSNNNKMPFPHIMLKEAVETLESFGIEPKDIIKE